MVPRSLARLCQFLAVAALTVSLTKDDKMTVEAAEPHLQETITPPDPDQPLDFDINCKALFSGHDPTSIADILRAIPINWKENWEDYTQNPECSLSLARNAHCLPPEYVAALVVPRWDFEGAPSRKERFDKLFELGVLKKLVHWNVLTLGDVKLVSGRPLAGLDNWTNFQPEVLAKLLGRTKSWAELHPPQRSNQDYIRRLLESKEFLDPDARLWYIFDGSFAALAARKSTRLLNAYGDMLVKLSRGVHGSPADRSLLALRLQFLVRHLVSAGGDEGGDRPTDAEISKFGEEKLRDVVEGLCPGGKCDGLIRTLLANWAPEAAAQIRHPRRQLRALMEILPSGLALEGDKNRDCGSVAPASLPFSTFITAMGEDQIIKERGLYETSVDEYISLYQLSRKEIEANQEQIEKIFKRSTRRLNEKLRLITRRDDLLELETVSLRAFRLLSEMLSMKLPLSKGCLATMNKVLEATEKRLEEGVHADDGDDGEARLPTFRSRLCKILTEQGLIPVAAALIQTHEDLYMVTRMRFIDGDETPIRVSLNGDREGFIEIKPTVETLIGRPRNYLSEGTTVHYGLTVDRGGPSRALFGHLTTFARGLVEECKDGYRPRLNLEGERSGIFIGMVMAKAFRDRLPPGIHFCPRFFKTLLRVQDDKATRGLFKRLYSDTLSDLHDRYFLLGKDQDERKVAQMVQEYCVFPLDQLRPFSIFDPAPKTDLETPWKPHYLADTSEAEEIMNEYNKRRDPNLTGKAALSEYYGQVFEQLYAQFKAFLLNFADIFGLVFNLKALEYLQGMSAISQLFIRPLLTPEMLLGAFSEFRKDTPDILSFFEGHTVNSLKFVKDMIGELDPYEIENFLALVTGYPTLPKDGMMKLLLHDPSAGEDLLYPPVDYAIMRDRLGLPQERAQSDPVQPLEAGISQMSLEGRQEEDTMLRDTGRDTLDNAAPHDAEDGVAGQFSKVPLYEDPRFWSIVKSLIEKQRKSLNLGDDAEIAACTSKDWLRLPRVSTCALQIAFPVNSRSSCFGMLQAFLIFLMRTDHHNMYDPGTYPSDPNNVPPPPADVIDAAQRS